jgi:hypothetical protein
MSFTKEEYQTAEKMIEEYNTDSFQGTFICYIQEKAKPVDDPMKEAFLKWWNGTTDMTDNECYLHVKEIFKGNQSDWIDEAIEIVSGYGSGFLSNQMKALKNKMENK